MSYTRRKFLEATGALAAAAGLGRSVNPLAQSVRVWMAPEDRPDVMTRDRLVSNAQVQAEGDEVVVIGVTKDVVRHAAPISRNHRSAGCCCGLGRFVGVVPIDSQPATV
jgi:anaerobic selenocysteine-containing dehydrogenase